MKVSRNELRTALMRAYEGAAYAIGDYEEVAELITWSEMDAMEKKRYLTHMSWHFGTMYFLAI